DEAFWLAASGIPGPVFIECPVDLLYDEATIRQWYADAAGKGRSMAERALRWYLSRHVEKMFAGSDLPANATVRQVEPPRPPTARVQQARAALAKAQRPLMVIGSQTMAQAAQAQQIAAAVQQLGIPVYLSGMARGLLGRQHPLQLRHQRRQALREADCVVLAGVPCDFRLDYGKHIRRSATLIAANRSARDARLNRRPEVPVIGDVGLFLQALAEAGAVPALHPERWQPWIAQLQARDAERETGITEQAAAAGEHVNPVALLRLVEQTAGDKALLVADGGDFVGTAAYVLHPRAPLRWLDPGAFGTLGVGAGFALGAASCHPDAEVWIIFGDGACGYGLVEFDSFVRHKIPVIAIVGNDAGWTQIAREQVKMLGDDVGTVLARTDYHKVAEGFGAEGIVVRTMQEVQPALTRARALARSGKPVLVNVWLDKTEFREGSLSM
ncbi:MAG: thiamine pyrophosphate-dependent enzyme, partial [Burkholderiaceae bacterium]